MLNPNYLVNHYFGVFFFSFFHKTEKRTGQARQLTEDSELGSGGLGEARALVESLTGDFHPVRLPRHPVGHVGHGCHPTIVSLQTESTHDSSGRGQAACRCQSSREGRGIQERVEGRRGGGRGENRTRRSRGIQMAN